MTSCLVAMWRQLPPLVTCGYNCDTNWRVLVHEARDLSTDEQLVSNAQKMEWFLLFGLEGSSVYTYVDIEIGHIEIGHNAYINIFITILYSLTHTVSASVYM